MDTKTSERDTPSAYEISIITTRDTPSHQSGLVHTAGDRCPGCQLDKLDYDSILNLSCSHCGFSLAGCFT